MPVTIAWIDGCWGEPDDLQLPLSDRGLQLADGLFETILVLDGAAQLLPEHLARWAASAELLGMNPPPSQQDLSGLIDEAIVKSDLHQASGALRLNWSRGSGQGRGIGIANVHQHRFWLTLTPCSTHFQPIKTIMQNLRLHRCDPSPPRSRTRWSRRCPVAQHPGRPVLWNGRQLVGAPQGCMDHSSPQQRLPSWGDACPRHQPRYRD